MQRFINNLSIQKFMYNSRYSLPTSGIFPWEINQNNEKINDLLKEKKFNYNFNYLNFVQSNYKNNFKINSYYRMQNK